MKRHNRAFVAAVLAVLTISGPAAADTFYIIRDGNGPCQVVEGHPPPTKIIIGGNKTYVTREKAESDMTLACKTG